MHETEERTVSTTPPTFWASSSSSSIRSGGLHELGHDPAKKFGVKVPEHFHRLLSSRLWSFRRGETEYGVKAIWLGGLRSSLSGMLPPAKPESRTDAKDGSLGMVGEARP